MIVSPRSAVLLALVATTAAGCKPSPAPPSETPPAAASVATPHRKAGYWKQTMTVEPGDEIQTMKVCLDKATDEQIAWWGQRGVRAGCEKNEVVRRADGSWTFSSVCQIGEGTKTVTDGTVVGDFDAKYQMSAEVTVTNSGAPEMDGTRKVNLDGEWLGDCPAGMRPGDAEMPNGQRLSLLDIVKPPPE